jgi:hypothetical protein
MTDKTAFSEDEWTVLSEAPMHVTLAMMAAGEHGPISMVKESTAAMRVITGPGARPPADELIAAIAVEAESKEVRKEVSHDARSHKGGNIAALIEIELEALRPAVAALAKLERAEAAQIGAWLLDIAREMANASKGVNDHERAAIDELEALLPTAG